MTRTPPPARMERLSRFARRHHWIALLGWAVLLVAVTVPAQAIGDDYGNGSDISLPGTQSQRLADLLARYAPQQSGDSVTVVLHDERGWETNADVAALAEDLETIDRVETVTPPEPRRGTVSPDGTLALVEVSLSGEQGSAPGATYEQIIETAQAHGTEHLQVELAGKGVRKVDRAGGGVAEGAGMLAALVVLVFMFGSLLAASLPMITALFAVGTTIGLTALVSHLLTLPDYTVPLLVLVGLGVGIDYALLVFSRYRNELIRGADRDRALNRAVDTAGRAVLFAGCCVIIALLGMFTLGIAAFEGMVAATAFTVLVTMVASLTLLPALLTLFGTRIQRRVEARAAKATRDPGERWRRWAWFVQRNPWPALVASVLVLGALALPALGMHLGFNDAGNDAEGTTSRASYDLIRDKLGPGANGPLIVVAEGSSTRAEDVHGRLAAHAGIVADRVSPPMSLAEDVFLIRAEPATGPQDRATADLIGELRAHLGEDVLVGGQTAAYVDYSQAISDRFLIFMVVVVGISGLLLMCVFRSLPIAIKAALLTLLSIGSSLGAMKLVYQDGLLWGVPGPVEAFMPVFIFAIVFGLSMDYEVFLLSRMREEWLRTGDAQRAVREGLADTGGVITAAAAIMCVIFGNFALSPDRMLQQTGFAMAVAVLLDAVVIRCLVVPAVMRLLGERAWWLPRWLDRLLPTLRVEGPASPSLDDSVAAMPERQSV